jgi:integrase/recombinase XerD
MLKRQAKVLSDGQIDPLVCFAGTSRYPVRNRLIVLPSVKAGLRAAEIANLTWDMVIDPPGAIGQRRLLRDPQQKSPRQDLRRRINSGWRHPA